MVHQAKASKGFSLAPLLAVLAIGLAATSAQATIIGVSGPNSSAGFAAEIIDAPSFVLDDGAINASQQGFNEAQGVTTTSAYSIDGGGLIDVGTQVDSHMIFLNRDGSGMIEHLNVVWTFSSAILGVMSDRAGNYELASTPELGAAGTNYPTAFNARGFENNDSYDLISPNQLSVTMRVNQPGDWIRVVTVSSVPTPESFGLMALGFCLMALRIKARR